jgi:hypothetical protein
MEEGYEIEGLEGQRCRTTATSDNVSEGIQLHDSTPVPYPPHFCPSSRCGTSAGRSWRHESITWTKSQLGVSGGH